MSLLSTFKAILPRKKPNFSSIISAFTKVENDLNDLLEHHRDEIADHQVEIHDLTAKIEAFSADMSKARNVLGHLANFTQAG